MPYNRYNQFQIREELEKDGVTLCERIRALREDRDLRQQDLAQHLKCTQVCYSHYERGTREIPISVLCQLADFYETSTDYLLGRTNTPIAYPAK